VGTSNGTFNKHEYFTCKANHGMLVLPKHVSLGEQAKQSAVRSATSSTVDDEEC
jgi:hypothetical protein